MCPMRGGATCRSTEAAAHLALLLVIVNMALPVINQALGERCPAAVITDWRLAATCHVLGATLNVAHSGGGTG